jgi:rhamnulokinase
MTPPPPLRPSRPVGDDWAFISSGTWSLVGTVLERPCISGEAREMNFTNLGGVGGTICFLKNVNGMWLLRQCMDQWEKAGLVWTVGELLAECPKLPRPKQLIDVDHPELMVPGDLPARINAQLLAAGQAPVPADRAGIPEMANLIFSQPGRALRRSSPSDSKHYRQEAEEAFYCRGRSQK